MEIYVLRGVSQDGWSFVFSDTFGSKPTQEQIKRFAEVNNISIKSVMIFVSLNEGD